MSRRKKLEQAILAPENLRGTVDGVIINPTIANLRKELAMNNPSRPKRKLATILFTDIVGRTGLTLGLDAAEQMAVVEQSMFAARPRWSDCQDQEGACTESQ